MPLWAKVDVDMPTDEKLFGQPLATRHLWTCLICLAKRQDDDGAVRGYTCDLLAGAFNIPRKLVAAALTHYQLVRMVELDPGDGTIHLVNFSKRQGPEDTSAERASRYYQSHRENIREKRRVSRRQSHGVLTPLSHAVSRETVSLEVEEEVEEEKDQKTLSPSAPPPSTQPITELESDWPKDLLSKVKEAITSTRKSGQLSEGPWRSFLLRARLFAVPIRVRSASEYLDRAYASEGKDERYLLGIMRGERKQAAHPNGQRGAQLHVDNEKLRLEPSGRKML